MLNESRLLNFISSDQQISLQFFEGQKLISDLAITHSVKHKGFSYFRDIILSTQPLMALLKHEESFGIYIDSDEPYFRFKIEMSRHGHMRTLLLPQAFDESPESLTGLCRLAKTSPGQESPYTSIVKLEKMQLKNLPNHILKQSYQIEGEIHISQNSDQSLFLMKLPSKNEGANIKSEWLRIQKSIAEIYNNSFNNEEDLIKSIGELGYSYLGATDISFKCNCSIKRMLAGISSLAHGDLDSVFDQDNAEIEVTCDYCHKPYKISRKMLAH